MTCARCKATVKAITLTDEFKDRGRTITLRAFFTKDRCWNCGMSVLRRVVKRRRQARIGGKRGRNSGKVSNHGKG